MSARSPELRRLVAQIGGASKHGHDTTEARRALRAARAEDYIKALVDGAPALSAEQRDRLAVLLRSDGGVTAA